MEARRNALRAQRDKILSRKKKEREFQLQKQEQVERLAKENGINNVESPNVGKVQRKYVVCNHYLLFCFIGSGKHQRPRSGRAARAALNGEESAVDEKTIQYRRLLLQKIKEEVESPPKYEMR